MARDERMQPARRSARAASTPALRARNTTCGSSPCSTPRRARRDRWIMPGAVRAVDQRVDAARLELAHDFGDRKDDGGRARDVIDQAEPRPRGERVEQASEDFPLVHDRQRDLDEREARASRLDGAPCQLWHAPYAWFVTEDFVARLELEGWKRRSPRRWSHSERRRIPRAPR